MYLYRYGIERERLIHAIAMNDDHLISCCYHRFNKIDHRKIIVTFNVFVAKPQFVTSKSFLQTRVLSFCKRTGTRRQFYSL